MLTPSYLRALTTTLAGIVVVGLASPAMAASAPSTRVVACRTGSCLLVTGHRDNAASAVSLNGHVVPVEGDRAWRVSLPVETVRAWSVPLARTIEVTFTDAATHAETATDADLPIGLLGHSENLASLVISMK
jgi:hypothetical protein